MHEASELQVKLITTSLIVKRFGSRALPIDTFMRNLSPERALTDSAAIHENCIESWTQRLELILPVIEDLQLQMQAEKKRADQEFAENVRGAITRGPVPLSDASARKGTK
jgi:hypothetical protein